MIFNPVLNRLGKNYKLQVAFNTTSDETPVEDISVENERSGKVKD